VLARAEGEVVSPNGETFGIEFDKAIIVEYLFHWSKNLLFEVVKDCGQTISNG
jgi:hypothetical protein